MKYIVGGYLAVLSIEDIRKGKIALVVLLTSIGVGGVYAILTQDFLKIIIGVLPGLCLCLLAGISSNSIGMADGIITIFYGLIYGWQRVLLWLIIGFWLTAVTGVIWNIFRKEKRLRLPFIPFLTIAHIGVCL